MRFRKTIISVMLVLVMMAGAFPMPAYSYQTGNDYPAQYRYVRQDSRADEWQFYVRECVSFVAHCLNSRNKVHFHNYYGGRHWGNARNWISVARSLGYKVDYNPKVGSVACYTGGRGGHVAWVRSVNGNSVTVEEYNWGVRGGYSSRTVSKYAFSGFIHLKDIVYYSLNVNMSLDGKEKGKGYSGVTFDVTLDGKRVAHNVQNYCEKIRAGTSYKIDNIKIDGCYKLKSKSCMKGEVSDSDPIMIKLATKHDYNQGRKIAVATCTESGKKIYTCVKCGHKKEKILTAKGHAYELAQLENACDGKTYLIEHCRLCGDKQVSIVEGEDANENSNDITGSVGDSDAVAGTDSVEDSDSMAGTDAIEGSDSLLQGAGPELSEHIYSAYKVTKRSAGDQEGERKKTCLICGKEVTVHITPVASVKLAAESLRYNGRYQMPECVILNAKGKELKQGRDYRISYSHCKKVGRAKAKITFLKKYKGSLEAYYQILPKTAKIKSVEAGKDSLTVKLSSFPDSRGASRYAIYYRQMGSDEWIYGGSTSGKEKVISSLKRGKTYEVRARAYEKIEEERYRGDWSKVVLSDPVR